MSWYTFGLIFVFGLPLLLAFVCMMLAHVLEEEGRTFALLAILFLIIAVGNTVFGSEIVERAEGRVRYELRDNNDGTKTWHRVAVEQKESK